MVIVYQCFWGWEMPQCFCCFPWGVLLASEIKECHFPHLSHCCPQLGYFSAYPLCCFYSWRTRSGPCHSHLPPRLVLLTLEHLVLCYVVCLAFLGVLRAMLLSTDTSLGLLFFSHWNLSSIPKLRAHQWQTQSSWLAWEVSYPLHLVSEKHRNPTLYGLISSIKLSLVLFRVTKITNFQHPLRCFRHWSYTVLPLIRFLRKRIKKTSHLVLHFGLLDQLSTRTQRSLPLLPCLGKGLCQEPHLYQRHADAGFLQQVTTWRWFHATTHPARHRPSVFLLASAAHLRKIPVLSTCFLVDNSTESSSILKRNFCTGSSWCCFHPLLSSTSCSSLWVLTGCTMNRTTEINVPSNHKNHVSVLNNAFI